MSFSPALRAIVAICCFASWNLPHALAQEAPLIARAQRVSVAALDSGFPGVPFAQWLATLRRLPASGLHWEVNDCGEGGDGHAAPTCVEAILELGPDTTAHASLIMAGLDGRAGKPAVWMLYVAVRDSITDFKRLRDWAARVRGATAAAGQDRLSGTWQGYWSRAGDTMAVTMTVRRDSAAHRYAATFTADRLRVSGIPFAEVQVQGCCDVTLTLRGDRTTTQFVGSLRSDSLTGVLREGASEGRFAYSRAPAARPAFQEQEITFSSGAVTLAGSLLLPATGGGGGDSLPAVVFLHGSGPEGRWASRYLATQLATHGIAALIFDKRGVGGSTGDWRRATPDDLVGDGVAAVARLLDEPRIGRGRIGIHGHSQGGTLAPWVAARAPAVAFVIASAAAGLPVDSVELFSVLNSVYPAARTAAESAGARAYVGELVAVAYRGRARGRLDSLVTQLRDRPWFFELPAPADAYWWFSKSFAQYRPLDWWAQVRVPVLLVYGAEDRRVPAAESAARIARALGRAGNTDVAVRIFPAADHTFRLAPGASGWPVTAPGYIPRLLEWLAKR